MIKEKRQAKRRVRPQHRGPLMLLGDGLLLFLALTGVCFSVVTAYHVEVFPEVLLPVCVGLSLVFTAIYALRRWWLPLLGAAGLCTLAVWKLWDGLVLGEIWVRCAVVNTLADELRFLDHIAPLADLTKELWIFSATLLLALAAAGMAALLGWAVIRARSGLLVFLLTFPPILPALCITGAPGWLPFLALLTCWTVMLLTGLCAKGDPEGGARATLVALPAAAVLLGLLTVLLPQEDYTQPVWAEDAQKKLVGRLSRIDWGDLSLQGVLSGPFGGFSAAGSVETVDLENAGPLNYTGRTVLRVEAGRPGKLYLRGYSAGIYTGSGWEQLPEEAYKELRSDLEEAGETMRGEGEDPLWGYEPLNFPALTDPDSPYYPVTVENLGAPGGCVYYPYQLLTTPEELAGAQFRNDSYLARGRNVWKHTVYYKPTDLGDWTQLTGEARRAQVAYRQFVQDHYMDLPAGFTDEVIHPWFESLMDGDGSFSVTVGNHDGVPEQFRQALQTVDVVTALLDRTTEYDPDVPALAEGEDFVSCFLNETRKGYCMHYATAATLLLRWYGVPARYVGGFVVNVPKSGTVDVPDSAAHAWVEIYLDGYGWYPVDVTPGYQGNQVAGVEAQATPAPTPTPTPTPSPSPTPKPSSQPNAVPTPAPTAPPEELGEALDWRWLVPPAILAAVVFLFLFRRALAQEFRTRKLEQPDTNRAVLYGYGYYQRLRRWGAGEDGTVEELARKAKFSQHVLTETERESVRARLTREAQRVDRTLPLWKRLIYRYFWGLF